MTAATQGLGDFLLACAAEDEAVALAATEGPWQTAPSKYVSGNYVHQARQNGAQVRHATDTTKADAAFIARNDPASALRTVRLVRELVALHYPYDGDRTCIGCQGAWNETQWGCPTLELVATTLYGERDGAGGWGRE